MFAIGQVVFSKCGRDKGAAFVVTAEEGEYIWLVDGKLRKYSAPKKKKIKHVQVTYHIDVGLADKIERNAYLVDADFIKALSAFNK